MSENVFIVWGKNKSLAIKVRDLLSRNGYFPTVGGSERGAEPATFFVNSNVIQGMDNASFGIILVQRIFDKSGNPTGEFRPNLMFEWGYLLRRLRADALHVFLIGIGRDELPDDVLSAYTHPIVMSSANPSEAELTAAATDITDKFLADVVSIDFDGLEIIQNYDQYRTALLEMSLRRRAFNAREAGYFLLHMIQPAFYRNDLGFIKKCLGELLRLSTGQFVQVAILIDQIIRYYGVTERLHQANSPSSREFQDLLDIDRKLQSIRGTKNKVYNIFDVIL
jgi:hypothetical protein